MRWAAATARINLDSGSKQMSLAEVVQAKVQLNRWEKMKRGLKRRYSTITEVRSWFIGLECDHADIFFLVFSLIRFHVARLLLVDEFLISFSSKT